MPEYHFETREFGVSDTGIHRLRSGFNFETIDFSEVDSFIIERGRELNNWILVLVIGAAMVLFSLYYSLKLFNFLGSGVGGVIYIEQILVPLFPFLIGGYCLYSSMKNGMILQVRTKTNKSFRFSLNDFERDGTLGRLGDLLKAKVGTRVTSQV